MGNVGPIVLRSDSFRRCWVLCTRHRFLRFRYGPWGGAGNGLSPRATLPETTAYIYCKGEGALCAQMTEGRITAPLSRCFLPPTVEQERSAASPCPPHLHLDNKIHHYDLLSDFEAINRDCRFYNPALTYENYGHLAEPGGQNSNAEITAKGGRLNDEQVS